MSEYNDGIGRSPIVYVRPCKSVSSETRAYFNYVSANSALKAKNAITDRIKLDREFAPAMAYVNGRRVAHGRTVRAYLEAKRKG